MWLVFIRKTGVAQEVIAVKLHEQYMREAQSSLRDCLSSVSYKRHLQWRDLEAGGSVFLRAPMHSLQEIRLDVARGKLRASDLDGASICHSRLQAANRALTRLLKKKPRFASTDMQVSAFLVTSFIAQLSALLDDWPEYESDNHAQSRSRMSYSAAEPQSHSVHHLR